MDALLSLDALLLHWLNGLPHPDPLNLFFLALSYATAFPGTLWILLALVMARGIGARERGVFRLVWALAVASLLATYVVKPAFARPRPFVADSAVTVVGVPPLHESFPSGHATSAAAGAYALSLIAPEARVAWWALALLVGLGRVYLGVHYPLDVVGGWLLGLLIGMFVTARVGCRS